VILCMRSGRVFPIENTCLGELRTFKSWKVPLPK
jgi:hypothetical protein